MTSTVIGKPLVLQSEVEIIGCLSMDDFDDDVGQPLWSRRAMIYTVIVFVARSVGALYLVVMFYDIHAVVV